MGSHRGQQKRTEKKRKQRQNKIRSARPTPAEALRRARQFLDRVDSKPFGPCYVSTEWRDTSTPKAVELIVTRELADGRLFALIMVVDRACTGVMLANSTIYDNRAHLDALLEELTEQVGSFDRIDPIEAQSIVFHALDYAGRLGFGPHGGFLAKVVSPRPETLLDTPWSNPEKPVYLQELHGKTPGVREQLDAAVGREGYEAVFGERMQELIEELRRLKKGGGEDDVDDEDEVADEDEPNDLQGP